MQREGKEDGMRKKESKGEVKFTRESMNKLSSPQGGDTTPRTSLASS